MGGGLLKPGIALLLLLLPLVGCERLQRERTELLPVQLSLIVERTDGSRASILLALKRNGRDQLDVRLFEGSRLYDGRHVFEFSESSEALEVHDVVDDTRATLTVGGPLRLVGIERGHAWLEGPNGIARCHLATAACQPSEGMPELPLTQAGPFNGFKVALSGGVVRVLLPRMQKPKPVFEGARRIVGVHWVRREDSRAKALIDRTFRGQATLLAGARPCELDGAFADWADMPPAVVENRWQLQSGADGWDGPRDGSFSVVATWTAERVCFAGRVRDDAVTAADQLTLQVFPSTLVIPLAGNVPEVARRNDAPHGVTYEACVPTSALPATDDLAFRATLVDADPGEPTTQLATAPEEDGRPLGHLVLLGPTTRRRPGG